MATKKKAKKKAGSRSRKTVAKKRTAGSLRKKGAKKKSSGQRPVKRGTAARKTSPEKATKKKTLASARKKTAVKRRIAARTTVAAAGPPLVEPGPPAGTVPPVEEPTQREEAIGIVTHYYSHLGVAVIQLNKGELRTGDTIHVKGHTTDFTQAIDSLEYEHRHIDQAAAGQSVGLKVIDHAREHDIVYVVK